MRQRQLRHRIHVFDLDRLSLMPRGVGASGAQHGEVGAYAFDARRVAELRHAFEARTFQRQ
jgi:hypothetical protein